MTALTIDLLVATANAYAAAGEWRGLRELLDDQETSVRGHVPLATMRAEAKLRTGRPREAHAWLVELLPSIERSGDRVSLRTALNLRGVAEIELGALAEAEITFACVLELARADGDELLAARALNNIGAIADIRERAEEALLLYRRAIPSYQRIGNVKGLAESYHNIATTLRQIGQLDEADECERRAITYAAEIGNTALELLARAGRAELSLLSGDAPLAEAAARHVAKSFGASADPIREADVLRLVGAACLAQGKHAPARDALDRALSLALAHGARLVEAETRRVRAELLASAGNVDSARAEAEQAAQLFASLGAAAKSRDALAWREQLSSRAG